MELETRQDIRSHFFEARHKVRRHLELETLLLEVTATYPEDGYCHTAREALQLGVGYAYLARGIGEGSTPVPVSLEALRSTTYDEESVREAFEAYFSFMPYNKYLSPEALREQREQLALDALMMMFGDDDEYEPFDPFEAEALVAFNEGVQAVSMAFPAHTELAATA